MKRFVIAPDSFKGTMSAQEVCGIIGEGIRAVIPDAELKYIPMADGGEGLTSFYLELLGGRRVTVPVTGPLGTMVEGFYGILPDETCVIEMAAAAGLPLAGNIRAPLHATTCGVGELIRHAIDGGAKKIILGLGGSATNDCGIGMAAALGWRFLDLHGNLLEPIAANMGYIEDIVAPQAALNCEITAACDVQNPLLGENGATAVYGPQKGVTPQTRPLLEAGLERVAAIIEKKFGLALADMPGAGAAGGMGAAVPAFLGGELKPGIELLLDTADFDGLIRGADLVITGEGRMDAQSANGKVPMGVGLRCKKAGVPCVALCGSTSAGADKLYDMGISAYFSAVNACCDFEEVKKTCRDDLRSLTVNAIKLLKI